MKLKLEKPIDLTTPNGVKHLLNKFFKYIKDNYQDDEDTIHIDENSCLSEIIEEINSYGILPSEEELLETLYEGYDELESVMSVLECMSDKELLGFMPNIMDNAIKAIIINRYDAICYKLNNKTFYLINN